MKKLTTIEFIEKAELVHGDRYDYSRTKYVNRRNVVEISCKKHGLFQQTPSNHLAGQNCPVCMNKGKSNVNRFITYTIYRKEKSFKYFKNNIITI